MELTGEQRKKFREALIAAFPQQMGLERMLSEELEWKLNTISGGDNYSDIVFNLINYAESKAKVIELLKAAIQSNPGNHKLKEFEKTFHKNFLK